MGGWYYFCTGTEWSLCLQDVVSLQLSSHQQGCIECLESHGQSCSTKPCQQVEAQYSETTQLLCRRVKELMPTCYSEVDECLRHIQEKPGRYLQHGWLKSRDCFWHATTWRGRSAVVPSMQKLSQAGFQVIELPPAEAADQVQGLAVGPEVDTVFVLTASLAISPSLRMLSAPLPYQRQ